MGVEVVCPRPTSSTHYSAREVIMNNPMRTISFPNPALLDLIDREAHRHMMNRSEYIRSVMARETGFSDDQSAV